MYAHLGAGLDVPDFDEVVIRASDDALPVRREGDRAHGREVPLQRANLHPREGAVSTPDQEWINAFHARFPD